MYTNWQESETVRLNTSQNEKNAAHTYRGVRASPNRILNTISATYIDISRSLHHVEATVQTGRTVAQLIHKFDLI